MLRSHVRSLAFLAVVACGSRSQALNVEAVAAAPIPGHIKLVIDPSVASLDMLFVIDDSGSMGSHQHNLMSQAPAIADELGRFAAGLVHVAVITTTDRGSGNQPGPGVGGQFFGSPAVLSSGHADFATLMARNFNVGTRGSPQEAVFAPLKKALSAPLVDNENKGFLRSNAHLSVVVLTDEEDQSVEVGPELATSLKQMKGTAGFSMLGFLAQSESCRPASGAPPRRIMEAIALAGGTSFDLCSSGFDRAIRALTENAAKAMTREIPLPSEPVFSSIEVVYGTARLAAGDAYGGWTYDSRRKVISLGEGINWSAQPAGTKLEVTYVPVDWTR